MPNRARSPRPNYSRKLTRRITLADGTKLQTVKDAADLLTSERFAGVPAWPALEHAIELVMEAGDRGGQERIRAATNQIEFVLRRRHMLQASIGAMRAAAR
jgi:hypothetical protein